MYQVFEDIKAALAKFWRDLGRLFNASKSTTLMILVLEVFLGLLLVIELSIVGDGVDAIIGARQNRIWTSEITRALQLQLGVFILLVGTIHLKEYISGVAARLGGNIRETVFVISTYIASIAAAPVWLTIALISLLAVGYTKSKIVRVLFSVAVLVITYFALHQLLEYTVYKSISVGRLIVWGGALLGLTAWLTLKPHLLKLDAE